jgi:hypothetical protein
MVCRSNFEPGQESVGDVSEYREIISTAGWIPRACGTPSRSSPRAIAEIPDLVVGDMSATLASDRRVGLDIPRTRTRSRTSTWRSPAACGWRSTLRIGLRGASRTYLRPGW